MAINMEAAQLVVGVAVLDSRYRKRLLSNPARAIAEVAQQREMPVSSRPSAADLAALSAIRARTLAEFAHSVEALSRDAGRQDTR